MKAYPFGIGRLDEVLQGGAPTGNVVLLAGETGAGAREFLYTGAAMNALGHADEELFDLYYGDLEEDAELPPEVHYLSFTGDEAYITREMSYTMDEEIVEAAAPHIEFRDFAAEYFQLSPIPREWYAGETSTVRDLGSDSGRDDVLEALGDYLNDNAQGSFIVVDSISDLVGSISDEMEWSDIATLMKGLSRAAYQWDAVILLLVNTDTLTETEFGHLMDAAAGTLQFSWETGGSQRARTMFIKEFRGVLSRLEAENIVRFETEIHDGGFDISDVRKIR